MEQNEQIKVGFISEPPKYMLAATTLEFNIIIGDNNKTVENMKNLVLLFIDKELMFINIDCRFHKSKWKCQDSFPSTRNNITRYKIFPKIITGNSFSIFTGRKIRVISPDIAVLDVHVSGSVFKDGETLTIWREKYSEIPIRIAIISILLRIGCDWEMISRDIIYIITILISVNYISWMSKTRYKPHRRDCASI